MKAIIEYVPKTKREAIRGAYRDDDGYWISLKEGWEASNTDGGCRTIHEDTIAELKYQIAGIRRIRKGNNTMAKTSIINVEIDRKINTVYVTYSSGTEKLYPANKLPKTVQAWLEEHPTQEQEPEEKIDLNDDSQTAYLDLEAEKATWRPVDGAVEEVVEVVEEAVDQAVCKCCASSTQADLPAVTQKPKLTVPVEAEIVKDNSLGAAEAVAFGVMMAMAVMFWGVVGMIQILMSGIEVLWALARPRVVRLARSTVRSLPTVTTKRGLAVAVRVLPVLVGIMALM